jgi:hypothetical protein
VSEWGGVLNSKTTQKERCYLFIIQINLEKRKINLSDMTYIYDMTDSFHIVSPISLIRYNLALKV